jgi:ribosomal protein S17
VNVGDTVKVVECRPLSKNVSAVVVAVIPAEVRTEEE